MLLIAISPAVDANFRLEPKTPVSANAVPPSISESAQPNLNSTDSPGGPSPPPGAALGVFSPPPPSVSAMPNERIPPSLSVSDIGWAYSTVAGNFTFPSAQPYVVRYATESGTVLVNASAFVILSPGIVLFGQPTILNATDYRYRVRYGFNLKPKVTGNVTVTYDFRDDGPPKITAELDQSSRLPLQLSWVTFTSDSVASNGISIVDFAKNTIPATIATPGETLNVGPTSDNRKWSRQVRLNWSDAGAGTASVGRVSVGGLTGAAVIVTFPAGMSTVDPTLVGTSTTVGATDYTIQRKAFAYAGRMWAFWFDGSNIAYASSQISYSNGQPTMTWTAKMTAPSGSVGQGFDVDQRDGTVLVGYVPSSSLTAMKILKGNITGSFITWAGPYDGMPSWPDPGAGPPAVAIGTDGYYWTAVTHSNFFYVYRSDSPGGTTFTNSFYGLVQGVPSDSVARILALSNGQAFLLMATKAYSDFTTYRYTSSGWGNGRDWTVFNLPTADDRGNIMSAVALPDNRVRLVYIDNAGHLQSLLFETDNLNAYQVTLDGVRNDCYYPTVSLDVNGQAHVFYRTFAGTSNTYIYYTHQRPALDELTYPWSAPEDPFGGSAYGRRSYTAIPLSTDRAALIFTEGGSSPYSVKFGSVPTPIDFGSQTGQPWNRQGISPYQSYFQQFSEFVSPGSGLLTLKQTDLALPGRNLNLEISRVFVTPRAFYSTGVPPSSLYEDYAPVNLGKGWRLNLPWLSDQYLYLWDGQMYVVRWQANVFENHDGENFVLTRSCVGFCYSSYTLYAKDGISYLFDSSKRLTTVKDPSGNQIAVAYTSGRISTITDTIGRNISFAYNANTTLQSVSSGPLTVTYTYQTLGGYTLLRSVTDPMKRQTIFEHTDARSPLLMTAIKYPTGAKASYTWSNPAVQIGSDLTAYYVTLQDTLNSTGQSIRSNRYDYTVLNGKVSYVAVTTYDAGVLRGSTIQWFDGQTGRSTTVRRDASGVQLGKEVTWFSAGAVGQVDVYPGSSATAAYSTYSSYDDWGNLVYTRDAIGHEKFASYANTRLQGGYFAPGRMSRTTSGLLFFDDFEDRDISDWTLDASAGTPALDYTTFESLPPALKMAHNGAATGVSSATHTFSPQSAYFVAEAIVRAEETNKNHYVLLESSAAIRVYVALDYQGSIGWTTGSTWNNIMAYQASQWYRIGFRAYTASNTYDIWVNGQLVKSGATMAGSGNIDRIVLQASCSGCGAATMYGDLVKVYLGDSVTIQGLQAGQFAKFFNPQGVVVSSALVSGTSAALGFFPGTLPYGTINIFDRDGTLNYSSPTHEFWGGEVWAFSAPWREMPLTLTRSGFKRSGVTYVDDSLPTGAVAVAGEDGWDWGAYDFPVAGASSHRSKYLTGTHQHSFQDATSTITMGSGDYHIQYLFIPDNQYPSEIMLQFRDTSNSWEHRAYWGSDIIQWGVGGTTSRQSMGGLPGPSGRWLMLIATSNAVGMNGLTLEGLAYTLYGGRATWDFSATGDSETGQIRVTGLPQNWKVQLYDAKSPNVLRADSGLIGANGIGILNVYLAGITAFPIDGYFLIKDNTGADFYRSPVLSLWGGDTFSYSTPKFYPDSPVGPSVQDVGPVVHNRIAGTLEFQTGRSATPQVREENYIRYTASAALPDRVKVWDGTAWRESVMTYDPTYGFLTGVTDPRGNAVSYFHSATYGQAYATTVSDSIGTLGRETYDPTTGWPLSETDGRGYLTRYRYDLLGRKVAESRYDLPPASEVLYMDMEWTTEEPTPRMQDLSNKGNHGTITATQPVAGKVGYARSFAGSGNYITAADSATLDLNGNALAVTAWVYPTTSSSGIILNKENSYQIGIINGLFQAAVETSASGSWLFGGSQSIALNQWTHLAFVYESGTTWKFYVNGQLRETISPAGGQTGNIVPSSYGLRVGDRSVGSTPFTGVIDEVRLFSQALNASDVGKVYNDTYGLLSSSRIAFDDSGNSVTLYEPTTTPRLLHLDMESLVNGKLEDLSGFGHHGAMTGTSPTPGKVGGARSFSGSGQYVDVGQLALGARVSVSAWIKTNTIPASGTRQTILSVGESEPAGVVLALENTVSVGSVAHYVFWVNIGGTWYAAYGGTPETTAFHHVVGTYDGAMIRLYVDNVATPSTTINGVVKSPVTAGAVIGAKNSKDTNFFNGVIDEIQVFDRTLGAPEISSLYQGTEKGFYQKSYFDSIGRTTKSVRRDLFGVLSSWQTYTYNFQDQLVSQTVARNSSASFTTTSAYDFLGRPTSVTYPGTAPPVSISYDDVNRIRTVVAENGRTVQYLYDLSGRTTTVREYYDPTHYYSTFYAYDEVGNLVSVTSALSQVTQHQYDNLNRLMKTIYPDISKYETYSYDEVGNLKTKADRASQVTTYGYDARNRMTSIDYSSTGANPDVSYAYDLSNNPTSVSSLPGGPTIGYAYDGLGHATNETDTISGKAYAVGYSYDPAGRLTRLTYPDNAAISYLYDSVGRTSQVKDASVTYASFAYSADDLTNYAVLGNQVNQSYAYNGRAWPTSIKATYQATTYMNLGYGYDNSGNVLTMGSASSTYDKLDRLLSAAGGYGSQSFAYDAVGNRLQLDRNTTTAVLRPNGAGSSTQWTPSGCAQNWLCVSETTSDGDTTRVQSSTPGNVDQYALQDLTQTLGTVVSVTVTAVARYYAVGCQFDPTLCYGDIKLNVNGYSGGTKALGGGYQTFSDTWTTNPATGQPWTIAQVNALQAGVELVDVGNVARVTQVYVSVVIANRTTYTYTNGPTGMNQLTSLSTDGGAATSFTYDANGNLWTKTGGWGYEWGPDGLLARVTQSGGQVQKYTYDGLGRRLNVTGAVSTSWTVSIFSGMDVIFEKDNAAAVTKYVYANGMHIARISPSAMVQYYVGDHLDSTRKVLDASRATIFSTDYEPFGKPYAPSGSEAYKFTSERHDDSTGLLYLRAREYDPDLGRFVSADPVLGSLSKPQTQNRYAYVINNPLLYSDPTGECPNCVAAGIGAAIGALVGYVGCGIATGGWATWDCAIAAGAGAVVGGLAGLTFGASLSLAGAAGLGTAMAGGGFTFAGASGLAAFAFAGATSGAVAGATGYMLGSSISGQPMTSQGFVNAVGTGTIVGAITSAAGYGVGRGLGLTFTWGARIQAGDDPTLGGRPLSNKAVMNMQKNHITGEMVDEVVETGQVFHDPLHDSTVYMKAVDELHSGQPIGGKYVLVAENPTTGVIINTYPRDAISSRLQPPYRP